MKKKKKAKVWSATKLIKRVARHDGGGVEAIADALLCLRSESRKLIAKWIVEDNLECAEIEFEFFQNINAVLKRIQEMEL